MKKALTENDAREVKDVAEPEFSYEEIEQLRQLLNEQPTSQAIRTLAEKFGTVDGVGEALSLMTAAVAVTGSECAGRATIVSNLPQRELEGHVIEHASGHYG
jgi:hypothetical protein